MEEKEQLEKALEVTYKQVSDANDKLRKIKIRLNEIKFGFKTGDIIECGGKKGEAEITADYAAHFYKYKKDGNLSLNRSYIYNGDKVKVLHRKED